MLLKITILISAIALLDCNDSHFIIGPTWKNEISRCVNDKDGDNTSIFHLGTLDNIGLAYNDVNQFTGIIAHGRLQMYTHKTGYLIEHSMDLTNYNEENLYKTYSYEWEESVWAGWANQQGKIKLTIKIHKDTGTIELINYVYAGSWWAVTCSETKAYVDKIEIVTSPKKFVYVL